MDMANVIVKETKITCGVYEYTFQSGDVVRTCGVTPQQVYDALHKAHNTCVSGNCYLNGEFCSLKYALNKLSNL